MKRVDLGVRRISKKTAAISFVPALGEALLVMLGVMRVSRTKVIIVMALGKLIRYGLITATYLGIANYFGF